MEDDRSMAPVQVPLFQLPKELRLLIYSHLFSTPSSVVKVEPTTSFTFVDYVLTSPSDGNGPSSSVFCVAPHAHPLSSQLLRVNKQVCSEASPILYSQNVFDCTARDGIKLLLGSIPESHFTNITSLIIDWDQLLDFSFQMAKPEFVALTSNLTCLTMAHWRTRVLGGSSMLWRDVKAYERTVVQSALAITEKSEKLNIVTQHHWVGRHGQAQVATRKSGGPVSVIFGQHVRADGKKAESQEQVQSKAQEQMQAKSSIRIKWRFLASENMMWKTEDIVDLRTELDILNVKVEGEGEGNVQMAIDPF